MSDLIRDSKNLSISASEGGTPNAKQRLCVMCKHFYHEDSYFYSDTASGDGYFSCRKDHEEAYISGDSSIGDVKTMILFATTCPDYDDTEAA